MDKETFKTLYRPIPSGAFDGWVRDWGITVVEGDLTLTGNRGLCGQGILVVFGKVDNYSWGACPEGFQGLVYVAGNYRHLTQRYSPLRGALVVEGEQTEMWQWQAHGKIQYDPLVLHRLRVASGIASSISRTLWRRE